MNARNARPWVRLAALGLLLSLTSPLLAQITPELRQGSRHAGPGPTVNPSTATFTVGISIDNGLSFIDRAGAGDVVQIRGEIRPEVDNIGQVGDLYVVIRELHGFGTFRMLDLDGIWREWDTRFQTLVPFREEVFLDAVEPVDIFTGTLGGAGEYRVFLGYEAPDGILRYHTMPAPLSISETPTQTPREQALALFTTTIHPNVVQGICIQCHVPGDPLTGGVHQFQFGSGQAQIDANFQVFSALIGRGKDYILGKVRGENAHLGGAALPRGFPGYADFEQFLTLLEQR